MKKDEKAIIPSTHRLSVNIPEEFFHRLKIEATLMNITVTKYVHRILYKELKEREKLRERK